MTDSLASVGEVLGIVVWAVAACIAFANLASILLALIGFFRLRAAGPLLTGAQTNTLLISPMLPGISLLLDARGAVAISDRIDSLLRLPYPHFEVVAVCDGVGDEDVAAMVQRFRLYKSSRRIGADFRDQAVRGIFETRAAAPLVLVVRESTRGSPAALNSALAVARLPLAGVVEAGVTPTAEGLVALVRPFLDRPDTPPPACAGLTTVKLGQPSDGDGSTRKPRSAAAVCAALDQIRTAFGTVALDGFGAPLPVAGDFVLFDRAAIVRAGGFGDLSEPNVVGAFIRLDRDARRRGSARNVFVAQAVAQRMVPPSVGALNRDRALRARAELQVVRGNVGVFLNLNPGYGPLGLIALPVMLFGGVLAPAFEAVGYVLTAIGLASGLIDPGLAAVYLLATAGFGFMRSLVSVALSCSTPVFATNPIPAASAVVWSMFDPVCLRQAAAFRFIMGLIGGWLRPNPLSASEAIPSGCYEMSLQHSKAPLDSTGKTHVA